MIFIIKKVGVVNMNNKLTLSDLKFGLEQVEVQKENKVLKNKLDNSLFLNTCKSIKIIENEIFYHIPQVQGGFMIENEDKPTIPYDIVAENKYNRNIQIVQNAQLSHNTIKHQDCLSGVNIFHGDIVLHEGNFARFKNEKYNLYFPLDLILTWRSSKKTLHEVRYTTVPDGINLDYINGLSDFKKLLINTLCNDVHSYIINNKDELFRKTMLDMIDIVNQDDKIKEINSIQSTLNRKLTNKEKIFYNQFFAIVFSDIFYDTKESFRYDWSF